MRGAPKGHKKAGGRVAGTPNKTSKSLIEKLDGLGMEKSLDHPVVWMFKVAHGLVDFEVNVDGVSIPMKADPTQRINCMKEVAKYVSPQLKAIDHSGELSAQITHITETVIDPKG